MFNKMKHLIMIVLATTIGVATVTTNVFNANTTTVSAHAVQSNGPWETDTVGVDEIQPVHNGNQIYYSIDPNSAYQKYAKQAAADWNALGVIDLVQVPWGDQRSQIQVTSDINSEANSDEYGNTSFGNSVAYDSDNNIDYFENTTITWYDMSDESKMEKQVTTDHEFGHALGFAHDNRHLNNGKKYRKYVMTMNAIGDNNKTYALGGIEQRTLAAHYGITPDQWLNTNC